jgi:ankyrin repeat protein
MLRVLKLIPLVVVAMFHIGCNKDSSKAAPIVAAPLNAAGLNIKNECPSIRQNLETNHYSVTPGVYLTPLMKAAFAGNVSKVRSLLMHDKNIDMKDRYGRTALQYAILGGNNDTFQILLRAGANINLQNTFKASSAHLAAVWNRTEMVKQMVNSGRLDVNTTSKFHGLTMLHSAAANCNLDLIQFLIQHGADVNKKSSDVKKNELLVTGRTPLKEAMAVSAGESIDLLLQLGADPSL